MVRSCKRKEWATTSKLHFLGLDVYEDPAAESLTTSLKGDPARHYRDTARHFVNCLAAQQPRVRLSGHIGSYPASQKPAA